ncbi:MAG: GTPase ObgE, partial [Planctomycetota bacterium]
CRVILHLVDLYPLDQSDPIAAYHTIRTELEEFSPDLAAKPEIVAANKIDLGIEEDDTLDQFQEALPQTQIFPISGATNENIRPLLEALWSTVHPL